MKFIRPNTLEKIIAKLHTFQNDPKSLDGVDDFLDNNPFLPTIFRRDQALHRYPYYRARILGKHEDRSDCKSFKYPEPNLTKIGRANIKGCPVLYATDSPLSSVIELLKNDFFHPEVYLSIWKCNKPLTINVHPLMKNVFDLNVIIPKFFPNATKIEIDLIIKIFHIISTLYITPHKYNFTSKYSNKVLYDNNLIDVIAYPSLISNYESVCFAFNKDFANVNLNLIKVLKFKYHGTYNLENEFSFPDQLIGILQLIEIGEINNSRIEYREPNDEDNRFWDYYKIDLDAPNSQNFTNRGSLPYYS